MGGFIVGFDSDGPSIFQRQIDFIQQSGIVTAMVGMLQAPPGTRLFDRLQRESRVVDTFSGDNVDGTTNIIPRMGMDRLVDGYQSIMKQIYAPKNYYRRVRTLLKELKAPEINQPMKYSTLSLMLSMCIPTRGFGKGTLSLLAPDGLDTDLQAASDTSGGNAVHIRLPLPQNLRVIHSIKATFRKKGPGMTIPHEGLKKRPRKSPTVRARNPNRKADWRAFTCRPGGGFRGYQHQPDICHSGVFPR
jgi:hypothetical protein